jgi:hypothetical protein
MLDRRYIFVFIVKHVNLGGREEIGCMGSEGFIGGASPRREG